MNEDALPRFAGDGRPHDVDEPEDQSPFGLSLPHGGQGVRGFARLRDG